MITAKHTLRNAKTSEKRIEKRRSKYKHSGHGGRGRVGRGFPGRRNRLRCGNGGCGGKRRRDAKKVGRQKAETQHEKGSEAPNYRGIPQQKKKKKKRKKKKKKKNKKKGGEEISFLKPLLRYQHGLLLNSKGKRRTERKGKGKVERVLKGGADQNVLPLKGGPNSAVGQSLLERKRVFEN